MASVIVDRADVALAFAAVLEVVAFVGSDSFGSLEGLHC